MNDPKRNPDPLPGDGIDDDSRTATRVERGGEVRADNENKWSGDETARQERGLPEEPRGKP